MSRANRTPVVGFPCGERPSRSLLKSRRMWGGILLGLLVFASPPVHQAQAQSGPPGSGWVLTFGDEFQGTSLDQSKWGYVPAYIWSQVGVDMSKSDPSAVVEGNGVLQLLTYLTDPNGPITQSNTTNGAIWTHDTFTQKYGWFEYRCKMAPGAGMDEAFCMYSTYPAEYQEIDLPEWLGNRPNTIYLAHWFVPPGGAWSGSMISPMGPDWSADFHTYAVNWQPDSLTYYVDGIQYWQTTDHVPQDPLWISIGSGSARGWGGDINASTCPNSMVIDYVRVYQGGGSTPPNPPPPPPPPSKFTLSASPATVAPGGTVTASWTAPSGQASALDWIGLYVVGSDDSTEGLNPSSNRTWQYTGGSTSGSLHFAVPGASGSYEFRYFLNNSATKVATSNTVTVGTTPPPTGGVIYAGQGGSLTTSEGTWTFGGVSPDGVDSYCLLNGVANGWAAEMEIVGGSLYAHNTVNGNWYLRQNGIWVDTGTTAPSSTPTSGGPYVLTNQNSGLALDVQYSGTTAGTPVWQWTPNGSVAQNWQITPTGDGYYYLTNPNSGMDLSVQYGSTSPGAPLIIYPHTPGAAWFEWKITPTGDGSTYYLTNRNSGLDLDDQGSGTAPGTPVQQWPSNSTGAQKWSIPGFSP